MVLGFSVSLSCCLCLILGFLQLTASEETFKCPEQFGYYPDYQDCSKYYVCVFGDSLHEKCTGGLFFSTELQTCDWPRNVECANGEKPSETVKFDDEAEDEVFSSSRRATASIGRQRAPPNPEPVSNLQDFGQDDDSRDHSNNRPSHNQKPRPTSVTESDSEIAKQATITAAPTNRKKSESNPTTVPDHSMSNPDENVASTIPEDPLYLSDERSKVSDPLGNYDPQQPDFDEAAPPLVDSEGGIHIADGGHGLDAFAGLAHLPGLGDYSVIAKPVYNANGGTADKLSEDDDYRIHENRNPSSRNQPSISRQRSLESYKSNSGRSKDPDMLVEYNGNKNLRWSRPENLESGTVPPTIFDDNVDHRDFGRFDIITPLKTNGKDNDQGRNTRGSLRKAQGDEQNRPLGEALPAQKLDFVKSIESSNRESSRDVSQRPREDSSEELRKSIHSEISRLSHILGGHSRNNNERTSITMYRPPSNLAEHGDEFEESLSSLDHGEDSTEGTERPDRSPDTSQTQRPQNTQRKKSENVNRQAVKDLPNNHDFGYEKESKLNEDPRSYSEVFKTGEKVDEDQSFQPELEPNFGAYTGSHRQNRKIEDSSNYNAEGSKTIVPAESIQPSVRQPNQLHRGNQPKDVTLPDDYRHDSQYGEYDGVPPRFDDYDSKSRFTDDYTSQEDPETTTRSTTQYVRARPTRPRKPITTTTTTTTTTTPAPIRIRSRKPISQATPPTKQPNNNYATTQASPPSRPVSVYPTPSPYTAAAKCDPRKCKLPDCRCGGTDIPAGIPIEETPQIVVLTFDDAVNDLNHDLYHELFDTGRVNPNGCPILGTFYVSHEWTDYGQVQTLYSKGHEIASHSITHSYGEKFSKNQWMREIHGQREILHLYGGVKMEDIRGMRAPFLQIGGNKMFEMLYDANFTYDSSMPVYENNPPFWPYTLDYALNHECMIFPCPTKSYPGLWEVGMVMWVDLRGGRCSMGDACSNPPDEEAVTKMLMKNFNRHYKTNKSPFGLFYHSAWFNTQHHRRGFMKFLDEILKNDDVYLVTNWQLIQWMRDPAPLSKIKEFDPFNCRKLDRPPPCPSPTVCNVWYQGGVRYMKTCQPCPLKYPWIGSTGYDSKNKG